MITVASNYFWVGAHIEQYTAIIGGASLILTAIIHPAGIAPFFQGTMQHAGRWLVRARAAEWGTLIRRVGPWALLGAVLGYLIWPARVDSYSKFWMPLLGAYLALFIRSIVLQVRAAQKAKKAKRHGRPPVRGAAPVESAVPVAGTV